jgi:hypothetical protein
MKLEVRSKSGHHRDTATGVGWSSAAELFTCG